MNDTESEAVRRPNGDIGPTLPSSWEWSTVGELGLVKGGKRLPKGASYTDGPTKFPYIRVVDFDRLSINLSDLRFLDANTQQKISRYTISKDDVFISIAGTIGKVGTIPEKLDGANLTENAAKITELRSINNRYLSYYLSSLAAQSQIAELITASNQPKLALFRIEKIKVPVAPPPEQTRIVAEVEKQLTRLDYAVAALERLQANLKRYKAAVLKAACEGRLVPQDPNDEDAEVLLGRILAERRRKWEEQEWVKLVEKARKKAAQAKRKAAGKPARISDLAAEEWQDLPEAEYSKYLPKNEKWKEKYKEPERPDTSELPELPAGWVWVLAEQICYSISNGSTPKARAERAEKDPHRIPFIKGNHITASGMLDFSSKPAYVDNISHKGRLKRSIVLPGDVLMNVVGPPLGKASIVPPTYEEWNINQNVVVFRLVSPLFNNRYLSFLILGPTTSMNKLKSEATATAGQYFVNLTACRAMIIPLPPTSEQHRIVSETERRLSVLTSIEDQVKQELIRAERLRQSILLQAFTGKLVPQVPDDEPASVLLARIQQQNRVSSSEDGKTRGRGSNRYKK